MKSALKRLKHFAQHPATQLITGIVLLVSGLAEVIYDLMSAEHSLRLGVHHGVALFGLIQVVGSLPDLIEGIDRTLDVIDKQQE